MARQKLFWSNIGVYCVRNTKNNKRYVGSSRNLLRRRNGHFQKLKKNISDHTPLQEDYNIYGKEYFIFEVIEYCEKENLIEKEQSWMDFYKSYEREFGYNSSITADRVTHTEETRKKMRECKRVEKGVRTNWSGRKHSEETLKKMSKSQKKNTNRLGKEHSEESKKKMKKSQVLRWEKRRLEGLNCDSSV